jgi:hypothetical protein
MARTVTRAVPDAVAVSGFRSAGNGGRPGAASVPCAAVEGAGEVVVATEGVFRAEDALVDPAAVGACPPAQPLSTRTARIPERREAGWARTG